jgi:phage shock protein A
VSRRQAAAGSKYAGHRPRRQTSHRPLHGRVSTSLGQNTIALLPLQNAPICLNHTPRPCNFCGFLVSCVMLPAFHPNAMVCLCEFALRVSRRHADCRPFASMPLTSPISEPPGAVQGRDRPSRSEDAHLRDLETVIAELATRQAAALEAALQGAARTARVRIPSVDAASLELRGAPIRDPRIDPADVVVALHELAAFASAAQTEALRLTSFSGKLQAALSVRKATSDRLKADMKRLEAEVASTNARLADAESRLMMAASQRPHAVEPSTYHAVSKTITKAAGHPGVVAPAASSAGGLTRSPTRTFIDPSDVPNATSTRLYRRAFFATSAAESHQHKVAVTVPGSPEPDVYSPRMREQALSRALASQVEESARLRSDVAKLQGDLRRAVEEAEAWATTANAKSQRASELQDELNHLTLAGPPAGATEPPRSFPADMQRSAHRVRGGGGGRAEDRHHHHHHHSPPAVRLVETSPPTPRRKATDTALAYDDTSSDDDGAENLPAPSPVTFHPKAAHKASSPTTISMPTLYAHSGIGPDPHRTNAAHTKVMEELRTLAALLR